MDAGAVDFHAKKDIGFLAQVTAVIKDRLALDLDRLRQELADDEKRQKPLEQVSWSLDFAIRQLERERTRLEKRANG